MKARHLFGPAAAAGAAFVVAVLAAFLLIALLTLAAHAQPSGFEGARGFPSGNIPGAVPTLNNGRPPILDKVSYDQRINETIPAGLVFRDEAGRNVRFDDFIGRKPVILALVYYACPMLCSQVVEAMTSTLRTLTFTAGKEFDVVVVSFDPRDTWQEAAEKKRQVLKDYNRPGSEAGWHFLTGDSASIAPLTAAVGFHYVWDAESQQFAHPAGIVVLNSSGRLYRYFYGVEYSPRDVRLALIEASQNKLGTVVDQVLLFCYHYDPASGKYGAITINMLRGAGLITLIALVVMIFVFLRRERRSARPVQPVP